jgi:hypothetical protein
MNARRREQKVTLQHCFKWWYFNFFAKFSLQRIKKSYGSWFSCSKFKMMMTMRSFSM